MLNKQKGNMYDFVTHTWNPVKGKCIHDCTYCYMKRWGTPKPLRFAENELKDDLGNDNFIFVGSSTDMFACNVPTDWIMQVLNKCSKSNNKFLFQTKNTSRLMNIFNDCDSNNLVLGTTIESNRNYPGISNAPKMKDRALPFTISQFNTMVTIEPIIDFDLPKLLNLIEVASPEWINIGADSGNNNLPEPTWDKVQLLIEELNKFTTVKQKRNLDRLKK